MDAFIIILMFITFLGTLVFGAVLFFAGLGDDIETTVDGVCLIFVAIVLFFGLTIIEKESTSASDLSMQCIRYEKTVEQLKDELSQYKPEVNPNAKEVKPEVKEVKLETNTSDRVSKDQLLKLHKDLKESNCKSVKQEVVAVMNENIKSGKFLLTKTQLESFEKEMEVCETLKLYRDLLLE